MTNISRWNPWRQTALDPLTRWGGTDFEAMLRDVPGVPDMRVDINETAHQYRLKAELPGVQKDDINVSIDGNRLSITAEVRQDKEDKDGQRVCRERFYGQVHRSFTFDTEVDAATAEAKFDNGVLKLTLPKKAGGQTRRLAIQ